MPIFHKPRISEKPRAEAEAVICDRCGVGGMINGQLFCLPIYLSDPAESLVALSKSSYRAGWRYVYLALQEDVGADAIMDFHKAKSGAAKLRYMSRGTKPRVFVEVLKEFERANVGNQRAYYLQMLLVPHLNFEIVWFKDAKRSSPVDSFRSLTELKLGKDLETELNARCRQFARM